MKKVDVCAPRLISFSNLISLLICSMLSCANLSCAPTSNDVAAPLAGTSSGQDTVPPSPTPAPAENKFWIEPTTPVTIANGQTISVFSVFRANSSDPFPTYIDPSLVTFGVSSTQFLTLDLTKGTVTGVAEGSTTLTATYQGHSSSLLIQVSGSMVKRTITVSGQGTRSYYIYIPSFGSSVGPYPLLFSLHGGGGTAMMHAGTSKLNNFASQQKFYVAYPEGTGVIQTFNGGACCGSAQSRNVDDSAAILAMLGDIQAKYNVDPDSIFASGFSNGAIMSHRLACDLADKFAGIAAFSGGSGEFDSNLARYFTCNPSRPIRILHFHSTNDRNYPIAGGLGDGSSATPFYAIDATIGDWIRRNNVTPQGVVESPVPRVTCVRYSTKADLAKPSAPVSLCTSDPIDVFDSVTGIVFGGGHSWPGGVRGNSGSSDVPFAGFDANSYMWKYLTK
jgi:polyhydroxybutyrate depolymerase